MCAKATARSSNGMPKLKVMKDEKEEKKRRSTERNFEGELSVGGAGTNPLSI